MTMTPLPCPKEYRDAISNCTDCSLNQLPNKPLFPTQTIGVRFPELLFYLEAPGEQESIEGIPLVGKAGKTVFWPALQALNIDLKNIAIANVAKHRPTANRNPTNKELISCLKHIKIEIDYLQPKKIICMGKIPTASLHMLANMQTPKKSLRGSHCDMPLSHESAHMKYVKCYFTHHPAYVIYNGGLNSKIGKEFIADIKEAFYG